MDIGKLIVAVLFSIFFISCFFLCNLILGEQYHIEPTSHPRFTALFVLHLLVMVYMLIFLKMETLEEYLRTALCLMGSVVAVVTFT
jgi:hypothetical protein